MEKYIRECTKPRVELLADKKKMELYAPAEKKCNFLPGKQDGKSNL